MKFLCLEYFTRLSCLISFLVVWSNSSNFHTSVVDFRAISSRISYGSLDMIIGFNSQTTILLWRDHSYSTNYALRFYLKGLLIRIVNRIAVQIETVQSPISLRQMMIESERVARASKTCSTEGNLVFIALWCYLKYKSSIWHIFALKSGNMYRRRWVTSTFRRVHNGGELKTSPV